MRKDDGSHGSTSNGPTHSWSGTLLALMAACLVTPSSLAAGRGSPAFVCHPLMLEQECRTYVADMGRAATPHARNAIRARYGLLLQEREHTCPCDRGHEWIRIRRPRPWPTMVTLRYKVKT